MAKKKKNYNQKRKQGKSPQNRENYKNRILTVLRRNPNTPLNYKQIASRLGVKDAGGRDKIIKDLSRLAGKSKIDPVKRGKYKIAGNPEYFEGTLDMTTNANGYVIADELDKDIRIPHKRLNHALDGDRVLVYVFGSTNQRKIEGEIVEVIERKTTIFVGTLHLKKTFGFVEINGTKMYTDIFIPRSKIKTAKDGEVVEVRLDKWPKHADSPEGHVIKVLGQPGEHETEMQSILAKSGLASEFPQEVEDFANKIDTRIQTGEIKKRRDLRQTLTFTIDPKDAKDFDDALSFKPLDNGNYEIGVHIADVSHYVKPGTVLDEEAYERGTSIYLVDRTVPMLPEILSNKACSLRPEEDKYTFSALFEINAEATVVKQWFGRTAICSNARFAYREAQHIIATKSPQIPQDIALKEEPYTVDSKIVTALLKMNDLAQTLRSNRMREGAISFDKTEVEFDLDKNMEPVGIRFKTAQEANKLIEEFMLLANRKVAEFIGKQNPKKTFVYRCHDEPDGEKLISLKNLVRQFGYELDIKDQKTTARSLNRLLKNVQGKKEQNLVDTLTVRSMSKAYYSTQNIGHYGLAFSYYSHFTSPIRRYPDVMAHRLLQRYLDHNGTADEETYEEMCKHCSSTELFATEAERDSIKYMQVKFMQHYKNKSFLGVISGVTDFGLFVEIVENKCEGMVRLSDMREDHFDYDQEQYAVVGRHTDKVYRLGDDVMVKVKATDLAKRNLDLELLGLKEEFNQ